MPVLADFSPQGAPGQAGRAYIESRNASESWMDRAQGREMNKQTMDIRENEELQRRLIQPIKIQQEKTQMALGALELETAQKTLQQEQELAPIVGSARSEFNEIMRIPDTNVRAQRGLEWMSKYGQMANLQKTQQEFTGYKDIIGKMYVEQQTLNRLAETERLKNTGPESPIGKMAGDYKKAMASGDRETADWILAGIKSDITPKGMQLEVGPDGGIRFFQGAGNLTTPNTTLSQKQEFNQERILREGYQLMNILRPEDLGIQGVVGETVGGFLGQLDPKYAEAQVAENRSRLRSFREGTLRAVSDDTRFSNADRHAIEQMLPSDGWVENLPQARGKLRAIMSIMAQRKNAESARRGEKSWADLPPEELVKEAKAGKIDKDAAAAVLEALHFDWVNAQAGGE